jgi:PHD/YefM family antitoxin component YafN of YafNO toxin-antitoxin module
VKAQFIIDHNGKKLGVLLPMKEYSRMVEELEELEDIKLYDEAKTHKTPSIPIEEAFKQLDAKRKSKR